MVQNTQNCKQPNLWPYGSLVNLQTPDVVCGLHFYLHILESDSASSPWFMPIPFPPRCHQASGTSLIFLFLPTGKTWIFRFCMAFWGEGNKTKKPHQKKLYLLIWILTGSEIQNYWNISLDSYLNTMYPASPRFPGSQIRLGLHYISPVLIEKK